MEKDFPLVPSWWALALRGLIAILFGILALALPGVTLSLLVILFGAYVLIEGLLTIAASLGAHKKMAHWGILLLEGFVCVVIGIIIFVWPVITAVVLLFLIAIWAIVTGILEIIAAVQIRESASDEWLLIIGGILSFIFGIILLACPALGLLAVIWIIGIYAIIFGVLLFALAFVVKGWQKEIKKSQ